MEIMENNTMNWLERISQAEQSTSYEKCVTVPSKGSSNLNEHCFVYNMNYRTLSRSKRIISMSNALDFTVFKTI